DRTLMSDASVLMSKYVGIPKGSEHPNLAALVGLFLQSPEGQELLWENEADGGLYLIDGTDNHRIYVEENPVVFDVQAVQEHQETIDRLRARYQDMIARADS